MKSGKILVTIIVILLVLLLIGGGAFAYIYLATDILKSNKQLFGEYFAQITAEDGFIDNRIADLNKKKSQNPYENSGEITVEVDYPEEMIETDIIDKVNDLVIRVDGKVDSVNQKVEQNIEVDYGNDVILPINYRQDGNKFGLQSDELAPKYIAIRNENLNEFLQKFGVEIDMQEISNSIEDIEEEVLSQEELEQIKQIYLPYLQQHLLEENFSSIKTKTNESYTLELNGEQLKNIIVKILELTKQNTLLLDKVNEIMLQQDAEAEKIDTTAIDELIKEINQYESSAIPNLRITLVQSDKMLNQIIIQLGECTISIKKSNIESELNYNISFEMKEEQEEIQADTDSTLQLDNTKENENSIISEFEVEPNGSIGDMAESMQINLYFDIKYSGLDSLTNVQEKYEIGFNANMEEQLTLGYNYKINSNIEFAESVSTEILDETNALFLNDYDEAQLTPFLTQVGTRFLTINKNQMAKLGLEEDENPLLYSTPIGLGIMIFNMASEEIGDTVELNNYEIQQFNSKFTGYEGDEISGLDVNIMIVTVQNSNLSYQEGNGNLVKVTLDGIETTERVEVSETYTVQAVYGESGFITEMKITTNN